MSRDDLSLSSNENTILEERERLDSIDVEARFVQELRVQNLRQQERYAYSASRYPRQDNLLGGTSSIFQPTSERPRSNSLPYNDGAPLEDLQLALQIMSTSQGRPNPFGRHSILPHGPSHYELLLPNTSLSQLSLSASTTASLPARQRSKRKRDRVLEPSYAVDVSRTTSTLKYQEQAIYMPVPKPKTKKNSGSFPLPLLRERPGSTRQELSLASYGTLWERQQGDAFRRRLHRNQVPIEKDTSITKCYSKRQRKR